MNELLKGRLVRLSAVDAEELSKAWANWNRDSEFKRLLDTDPALLYSAKGSREWMEKQLDRAGGHFYFFTIRSLEDDFLLGDMTLEVINWGAREAFVGIAIGERQRWGKGCGTDALKLMLRYAFTELNLRRVSLTVFGYNPRAIRSYEKAGLRHEGRVRAYVNRDGRRWDEHYMGILREEWLGSSDQ